MDSSGLQQIILKCPVSCMKRLTAAMRLLELNPFLFQILQNRHFSSITWCLSPRAGAHGDLRARCDLHCYEYLFLAACSEPTMRAFFFQFSLSAERKH